MVEDRLLFSRLKRGDADALRRIYEKYRHDLLGLAVTLSNDRAAAEDAVHDAFVSFVQFSPRLRLRTSLRSYLLSAVANRVRSLNQVSARRAAPPDATDDAAEPPAPDYAALRRERTMLIEQAMAQLPYDQREAIILHLQSGMRFREIANCQNVSINTILSRYRYGLEKLRSLLAVKHLKEIRYNEQPPAGIFDRPGDAVVVKQEVDCLVDPDSGLVADGMTQEEACLTIVKQTGQALIDVDQATLCKLDLFFRLYPPSIWDQIRKMKEAGQWASEFAITGAPYREGDLWYVPVEIRSKASQSETQNAMIKFYHLEGKTLCFIIGSKEKGVVD